MARYGSLSVFLTSRSRVTVTWVNFLKSPDPTQSHLTTSAPRRMAFPGCSHASFDGLESPSYAVPLDNLRIPWNGLSRLFTRFIRRLESLVGAKRRFAPTMHYPTHRSGRRPCRPQPLAHELKSDGHGGPPPHTVAADGPVGWARCCPRCFPLRAGPMGQCPTRGATKREGYWGDTPHAPRPATQAPRPFAKRPGMG